MYLGFLAEQLINVATISSKCFYTLKYKFFYYHKIVKIIGENDKKKKEY